MWINADDTLVDITKFRTIEVTQVLEKDWYVVGSIDHINAIKLSKPFETKEEAINFLRKEFELKLVGNH